MSLQWAAEEELGHGVPTQRYCFDLTDGQFDASPVLHGLVADFRSGVGTGAMAAGFHIAVARVVGVIAECQRARTGIGVVALSGGVFQNALLLGLARRELETRRFGVLTHRVVPTNDGGLALGQAAIAGFRATAMGAGSG
jgi:hydrogenase maturation protein HypF